MRGKYQVLRCAAIRPTISTTTCQQSLLTRVKGDDDIKVDKSCHSCNVYNFDDKNTWHKTMSMSQFNIFQGIFFPMQPAWLWSLLVGSVRSGSGEKEVLKKNQHHPHPPLHHQLDHLNPGLGGKWPKGVVKDGFSHARHPWLLLGRRTLELQFGEIMRMQLITSQPK